MVDLVKRRFFKQCLSRLSVCGLAAVGANVLLAGSSKEKEFGLLAADGGDLQIVVIDNQGGLYPIVQLEGHDASEITGVAFSPDGKRLYFSSQRGTTGLSENGVSYEIQEF